MDRRSKPEQAVVIVKVIWHPVLGTARYSELTQVAKAAQIPVEQGYQRLVQDAGEAASGGSVSQCVEA